MRRTRKKRSVYNRSQATLLAEIHTRLLQVKDPHSLDSELQETMMISKMVVAVVAEEEEVEEVAEVEEVTVMTEAHVEAETEVVEAAAAEAAKSSPKMPSQPSEVVVSAKAPTKVNFMGLDYSRAF